SPARFRAHPSVRRPSLKSIEARQPRGHILMNRAGPGGGQCVGKTLGFTLDAAADLEEGAVVVDRHEKRPCLLLAQFRLGLLEPVVGLVDTARDGTEPGLRPA